MVFKFVCSLLTFAYLLILKDEWSIDEYQREQVLPPTRLLLLSYGNRLKMTSEAY